MSDSLFGRAALLAALLFPVAGAAQSQPHPVRATPLAELARPQTLSAPAEVVPRQDSLLAAELALPVSRIHVEVGQTVEAGQVLLELDRRDPTLQLRQAEAQRKAAEAQRELTRQRLLRGRELAERQFSSADDVLALEAAEAAASADLEIAESAVAIARRTLEKTSLRAPFAGEVVARTAQLGALAAAGSPLIRLVQLGEDEVEARLPAAQAAGLAEAGAIHFEAPGARLPLRLLRMTRSVDPASRTRTARLAFVEAGLAPGHSGSLVWQAPGFSLPAELIVQRDGVLGVFVVEGSTARFVALPGAVSGRSAEVALAGTTLVVSEGQQRLRDGDPVSITER